MQTGLLVPLVREHPSPTRERDPVTTQVVVTSFGYLHGEAPPAHITVDVRDVLCNPHTDPAMRNLTGMDRRVKYHVLTTPGCIELGKSLSLMIRGLVRCTSTVYVAVGCSGGRHRSVVLVESLADDLRPRGIDARVHHRDLHRPVVRNTR